MVSDASWVLQTLCQAPTWIHGNAVTRVLAIIFLSGQGDFSDQVMMSGCNTLTWNGDTNRDRSGHLAMLRKFWYVLLIGLTVPVGLDPSPLAAQPTRWDSLESPLPSWKGHSSDAPHRILRHQRVRQEVHSGQWAEAISLTAGRGTQIYLAYDAGQARVIDELQFSLWLRADRPGLQIAARVVLPRTAEAGEGEPLKVVVYGQLYQEVGSWQRLQLDQLPSRVAEQVRILRSGPAGNIDAREAYVDRLLLNVYGGLGTTHVWIDDVEIVGLVADANGTQPPGVAPAGFADGRSRPEDQPQTMVQMRGSVLWADGAPLFPRIFQLPGAALAQLKQLGFNAVQLPGSPPAALQQEAARLGLWLICPPPAGGPGEQLTGVPDRLLAWQVGQQLTRDDLPSTIDTVGQLRKGDPALRRPVVCGSQTQLRAFSRQADVMWVHRASSGSSLELTDYAAWLRHVQLLARPDMPLWVQLDSDYPPAWQAQLAALGGAPVQPLEISYSQLRQQARLAVAQGARGLAFSSAMPLNADHPATWRRTLALELLNLELQLLEPWVAAGRVAAPATSSQPAVTASLLQAEGGRLLLPLQTAGGAQYVPPAMPAEGVHFVVPGVPSSNRTYVIRLGGLQPLPQHRVTGGHQVSLESLQGVTAILMTEDPLVVARLSRAIEGLRGRAAELQCRLAAEELAQVAAVERQLDAARGGTPSARDLKTAQRLVAEAEAALAAGQLGLALQYSAEGLAAVDQIRRRSWNIAIRKWGHPSQLPLLAAHATLPRAYQLLPTWGAAGWGANQLPGGEMESLEAMLAAGWRHVRLSDEGRGSRVELSAQRPHGGRRCLHLQVGPGDERAPAFVEAPPVWIVSPPVTVQAGQRVRIEGWVQVPEPLKATADGLLIFDSVAGPAMAKRIGHTSGWQKFTLDRSATRSGPLWLTIALAGIGEAWVDDVTVQTVSRPTDRAVGSR